MTARLFDLKFGSAAARAAGLVAGRPETASLFAGEKGALCGWTRDGTPKNRKEGAEKRRPLSARAAAKVAR